MDSTLKRNAILYLTRAFLWDKQRLFSLSRKALLDGRRASP